MRVPVTIAATVASPVLLVWKVWAAIWTGDQSRGWDGTGHYSIAQFYDQSIFPNTLGWVDAYFVGMPFPNFYPPVFYWCVALLHKTHLFSFATAFKLVLTIPVLLMPLAVWWLAWHLSYKSRLVATAASLASVVLLVDVRFMGSVLAGLDYFSTFQIGLYTQPLGFVLMIAWLIVYLERADVSALSKAVTPRRAPRWHLALASVLLALTVLSNFFNAITATIFIAATLAHDLINLFRAADSESRREQRKGLLIHLISPVIALLLCSFWLVPMITEYRYFVTRPYVPETQSLFSLWLMAWYAVALVGSVIWWRGHAPKGNQTVTVIPETRKKRRNKSRSQTVRGADAGAHAGVPLHDRSPVMTAYLIACLILAFAVVFSATVAPSWFPLQAPRFLATLTFLLTVPVGFAAATAFRWLARILGELPEFGFKNSRYASAIALVLFLVLVLSAPTLGWAYAFYPKGQKAPIADALDFARQHRDGRYLVEVINPKLGPAWTEASFDARAINSYLGSQGNETISGVFHEASPNALFTLPVVNAFSNYPDSFGVSSLLADDLDFAAQPLSEQMKRAQFLGVKYLMIRTPAMKERVSKEIPSAIRHDIGWWAVFELSGPAAPKIQALTYRPALVLSSFTVKARRRNEMSFIRLAEEQFADNWFDVLLARSPETKIDRLNELDKFGALVIEQYDYSDEMAAFEQLRAFAQRHALVCFSADNSLFRRIQQGRAEFPLLEIIGRQPEDRGETVEALKPTYHYNSTTIRQQWKQIRTILEKDKIPTNASSSDVTGQINQNNIKLVLNSIPSAQSTPVLIASTFHPSWQRTDGSPVYAVSPFYTLTFLENPATISYSRRWFDSISLLASAVTAAGLCFFAVWQSGKNAVD